MAKKFPALRLIDTTFRDAQQSLLGGPRRGDEIVPIAAKMDAVGFAAMEAFGGATFETQVRRREDPWEYLRNLSKATPHTPIQALIRGQNLLANRNFPDDVVELFVRHAARCGVDVFRVFDPLNDLRNMEATVAAALKAKKKVQGALSYAISPAHNLELWCSLAKGLVNMGCHEIVIKDTSGLLSPQATWELVTTLKQMVKVPIDIHSHCSSGMAPMAYMAAVEAGADVLDVAMSPLAWGVSQPAAESVVAALEGGEYDTGLDLDKMWEVQHDVEELKLRHIEHLSPLADRVDASILRYHMPGFMLEDIHHQLNGHNAMGRVAEVLDELMFPGLAADYMRGPQPQSKDGDRPAPPTAPEPADASAPSPAPEPVAAPVGGQSAEFDVEVEGEVFKVRVSGAGLSVVASNVTPSPAGIAAPAPPKITEGTVLAPMQGLIVKIPVKSGDDVKLGDVVAVLEAMKMQNDIVTTVAGKVSAVYVKEGQVVTPNQPLLAIG